MAEVTPRRGGGLVGLEMVEVGVEGRWLGGRGTPMTIGVLEGRKGTPSGFTLLLL